MKQTSIRKQIIAAVLGNALDWYDFTLFGYMAAVISTQFFPPAGGWHALFATFTVFAVSFFVRPLGGILAGYCADVLGRRPMLLITIGFMAAGTAFIAFAPAYASAGILSSLMVLVARILQGIAAGSEFGTGTSFLIEHAPRHSKGRYGSWQIAGQGIAIGAAGLLAGLAAHVLKPLQFARWGWRLPFIAGLSLVPLGLYLRAQATETPQFLNQAARSDRKTRLKTLSEHWMRLIVGFGLVIGGTAAFYALFVFMPTYAQRVLGLDARSSYLGPAAAGAVIGALCPVVGALSDRVGGKTLMLAGAGGCFLVLYPAFAWLHGAPSLARLVVVELIFGACISIYGGPFSTVMAELFPSGIRATALSITYNLGVAAFGGLAPLVVAWLISATGDPLMPAYYVMSCIVLSLVSIACLPPAPAGN